MISFRPRRLLTWAICLSVITVIVSGGAWIGLGAEVRRLFTGVQIATLLGFWLFIIAMIMGLGLCVAKAEKSGVRWRNGIRRHELAWREIVDVRYGRNDPWVYLITLDDEGEPERHQVMAIQSTDGDRARREADRLRQLWREGRRG